MISRRRMTSLKTFKSKFNPTMSKETVKDCQKIRKLLSFALVNTRFCACPIIVPVVEKNVFDTYIMSVLLLNAIFNAIFGQVY